MELRPYQSAALDALRLSLAGGKRRLMLYSPTGSGKTEMALAMIQAAVRKGKRVAFIANRKQLVAQASVRFYGSGVDHGILQGENTRNVNSPVLIVSIDTAHKRGLPDVDLIVIDEAHAVAGSRKYRELLFKRNLVPVVGLSATPFAAGLGKHYDELGGPLFEGLIAAATIRDLIADEFLVDVEVWAPADPDLTGVSTRRDAFGELDYAENELAEAVDKPQLVGDIAAHWKRLAGKQTVVFAANIAHSKHIAEAFNAAGVAAEHIDYRHDDEERKAILDRFNAGQTTVLCNASLLAEGWDAPRTACMILARPTKSLTRFIQMAGRVLRPFPGKEKALLLDHSGTVARLGFPTDDLPLELDDGERKATAARKKRERLPAVCPACAFVKPAGVHACPACGFAPERQSDIVTADGELTKIERLRRPDRHNKQLVYSGLLHIAAKREYRRGWAANQYRALFGVWPRGLADIVSEPSPELRSWLTSRAIAYAKRSGGGEHAA